MKTIVRIERRETIVRITQGSTMVVRVPAPPVTVAAPDSIHYSAIDTGDAPAGHVLAADGEGGVELQDPGA